ncbi:MAG: 5'-methylthioadenosine/S-adenosylhomocysteine nucleosidase [Christensenellaceae bacterium]
MWGIIGAMDSEISLLRTQMQQEQEIRRGNKVFYRGYIEEQPVIVTKSGMGKVNAAMCAQMLIDLFGVDHLVNTGIAGGIAAGLHVGDVVIGSAAVQHDFDLTPVGYVRGHIVGPDRENPPCSWRMRSWRSTCGARQSKSSPRIRCMSGALRRAINSSISAR